MAADGDRIDLRSRVREDAPMVEERPFAEPPDESAPRRPRSRLPLVRWALYLLLPLVLLVGGYFYITGGRYMTTDDAYVEADKVALSTDVSGLVDQIAVHDNQHVAAGQVLFKLDPAPFRHALDEADAQLANIRDQILAMEANYRGLQAQITQAEQNVAYYQRAFSRQQALYTRGVAAQTAYDEAQHNLRNAQQSLQSLHQQAAAAVANLDGNPTIAVADHPLYRQALAKREEAARRLGDTVVRAPYSGIVTRVPSLQKGMYLAAATPAFSIVADQSVWIEAQPKETELTYVRPGQPATITVDTYPGVIWHGAVASLGPASASEFSLLPAENTSGNWVKVVQRNPLRIRLDPGATKGMPPLRAGMSVEVSVDTGHARGWPHFLVALFGGGHDS
jgi:membrane fusion protein, multidrug efflux system